MVLSYKNVTTIENVFDSCGTVIKTITTVEQYENEKNYDIKNSKE